MHMTREELHPLVQLFRCLYSSHRAAREQVGAPHGSTPVDLLISTDSSQMYKRPPKVCPLSVFGLSDLQRICDESEN